MTAGKLAWRRVECAADDGAGGRRVFCVFCAFGGPRPEVRGAAPALREWRAAAEGSEAADGVPDGLEGSGAYAQEGGAAGRCRGAAQAF